MVIVVVGGVETNFWVSSKELDNKLITDRHMKISNNGGREQNNVMFIDALRSIAPHRAKQAIDKNKSKI